jgi:hypothetical protein
MLTLISTIVSFLMGGLPKILDFIQDKSDKKHELELAKMQTERELQMLERGYAAQAKVEEIRLDQIQASADAQTQQTLITAQQSEMQAVYAHDISLNEGTSTWMHDLRASVRPVITYGFFCLLVAIDIGLFIYGWNRGVDFKVLADMLWDAEVATLFASIIAFHFGGRAFGK